MCLVCPCLVPPVCVSVFGSVFFLFRIVFFCDFRVFFGGYPPPGPPFPAKGRRRTPRAAQRPFFDDFWWILGSVLGVRGGRFPDFPATFFRWFLGTAPGTLFGGFWVDFGRFFGAIWVPFWRSLDFVILQPLSRQTIVFGGRRGSLSALFRCLFRTSIPDLSFSRFLSIFGPPGPPFWGPGARFSGTFFSVNSGPDFGGFRVPPGAPAGGGT